MRIRWVFERLAGLLALGAGACVSYAAEQPPTLKLPETAAPVSYRMDLTLDPAKDDFTGSIAIKLNVKAPMNTLWLNANKLTVKSASLTAAGKTFQATAVPGGNDFIGLQFDSPVPPGAAEAQISYTGLVRHGASAGIFEMEDGGDRYIFTQFESTDARDAFPCFDEPGYKVPWQLTLRVPAAEKAVSNTPVASEKVEGANKVYVFQETKPLPSYLVALGVGPFEFVDAGTAGKNHAPVRIVTPKGKAAEAKYAAEVSAEILTKHEQYFGVPFPYEKSDQVAIPVTFGFGAMENAGMVTYAQTLILAKPESDTINRQRGYASVAAHELAHQWFGDLVTPVWWNDIWLNEAFATWKEQKMMSAWKPEWKTNIGDVMSKLGAEQEDSLISARKIRQEIQSKDDISNAFDGITYQKGAAVIGMFENWIGEETFRKGVHNYMKQYAYKNATSSDFLDAISSAGKKNVGQSFSTFLDQPGVPLVSVALDCKGGAPVLHLQQQRFLPTGSKGTIGQVWSVPVCVRYGTGDSGKSECTLMTQATVDVPLKEKSCPAWVQANDKAVGYYRVDYQGGLLNALTAGNVQARLSAPERVDFMGNAESLAEAGKLPMGDALAMVDIFHADSERQVVQTALQLALEPRAHLVPENLLPNYQRFILKNFQARAHELGWSSKPGESDDVVLLRPSLLRAVAVSGGDQELVKQAQDLTEKWFSDHHAIEPNMLSAVLGTAAYYGDVTLQTKLMVELKKTQDRQVRRQIINAIASSRDPQAIEMGYQAVLAGDVPFLEGAQLLFSGQGAEATRKMPFTFLKAHYDDIVAKRPTGGGFDFGSRLPSVGASYCDVSSRDELKEYFEPKAPTFTGGPRALAQTLEEVDLCIAEKAAQGPSVVAFLQKY